MTYLHLLNITAYLKHATLSKVLEYSHLPVRAKNDTASLPCIYESIVQVVSCNDDKIDTDISLHMDYCRGGTSYMFF